MFIGDLKLHPEQLLCILWNTIVLPIEIKASIQHQRGQIEVSIPANHVMKMHINTNMPGSGKTIMLIETAIALVNDDELFEVRKKKIPLYFFSLKEEYSKKCSQDALILKRFKSFSRNIFDDFPQNEIVKRKFMRSHSLKGFEDNLNLFCK